VRLWSVVNVGEIKHAAQHSDVNSALGVTMEDEMTLDAAASTAAFDDSLEMVELIAFVIHSYVASNQFLFMLICNH